MTVFYTFTFIFCSNVFFFFMVGLVMDLKVKPMMKLQLLALWVILVESTVHLLKVLSSFKRLDQGWLLNWSKLRMECVLVKCCSVMMVGASCISFWLIRSIFCLKNLVIALGVGMGCSLYILNTNIPIKSPKL